MHKWDSQHPSESLRIRGFELKTDTERDHTGLMHDHITTRGAISFTGGSKYRCTVQGITGQEAGVYVAW